MLTRLELQLLIKAITRPLDIGPHDIHDLKGIDLSLARAGAAAWKRAMDEHPILMAHASEKAAAARPHPVVRLDGRPRRSAIRIR